MSLLKCSISSELNNVHLVASAIKGIGATLPLTDTALIDLELCVVETVNNSIEHAYNNQPGHEINIEFLISEKELSVTVYDKGKSMPADLLNNAPSFSELDSIPIDEIYLESSGRGLSIVKEVMDKVTYTTTNGVNKFEMIMYFKTHSNS